MGLLLAAFLVSCAPPARFGADNGLVTGCVLPYGQERTLRARWIKYPIPIAISASSFSAAQITQITQALDTWNAFYAKSLGITVFDYREGGAVRTADPSIPAVCEKINYDPISKAWVSPVTIYRRNNWTAASYDKVIMALTRDSCPLVSASPLFQFKSAQIEINFESYNWGPTPISGMKMPDLQSIVTHELGHLLGLTHSTSVDPAENGAPYYVPVYNASTPAEYRQAVMFYGFPASETPGLSEIRRSLNRNDQGRANCLYMDLVNS